MRIAPLRLQLVLISRGEFSAPIGGGDPAPPAVGNRRLKNPAPVVALGCEDGIVVPRIAWFNRVPDDQRRSAAAAWPVGFPPGEQARTCRGSAASRALVPAARRSPPGPGSPDGAQRPRRSRR